MASAATQTISLWDALTSVPDHRRPAGKRYPLASLLLIALAAMLAGRRDQLGIVRWGRRLKGESSQLSALTAPECPPHRFGVNCSRRWMSTRWNGHSVVGS